MELAVTVDTAGCGGLTCCLIVTLTVTVRENRKLTAAPVTLIYVKITPHSALPLPCCCISCCKTFSCYYNVFGSWIEACIGEAIEACLRRPFLTAASCLIIVIIMCLPAGSRHVLVRR